MFRMSMLRNIPVICGEQQIGIFQSACFDKTRKRVCAFVISSGLHGKRVVSASHIRLIGRGFILVDDWSRYKRLDEQQTSLFVRDTTGLLVGRITDYAIDQESMEIIAIEVLPGYFPKEICIREWMYACSFSEEANAWIIPVILQNQSCISKEGNEQCVCPR